jgi:mono/diheme cytochrome c family protein
VITPAEGKQPKRNHRTWAIIGLFAALGLASAALVYSVSSWSAPARARKLKNPVPQTPETIAAGMEIYMEECQKCHGDNGDGKGKKAEELSVAPADFTDSRAMGKLADGELFWKVTEGRRPMPAFKDKLSETQRWQVVDYIRTFAAKPASRSRPPLPSPVVASAAPSDRSLASRDP